MEFKAFKMDGLGNDFVIIDNRSNNVELTRDQIIRICDRKFIGCDQLIFVKKSNKGDAEMEFYNSDGSISGACGNGTRCVAFLIFKETDKKVVDLFVGSNQLKSKILDSFEKYNKVKNININLNDISKLNIVDLLKLIVMVSPFDVSVKQMFLELKSNKELYENILSTLEIELASNQVSGSIN